jgi:hypothetical protein
VGAAAFAQQNLALRVDDDHPDARHYIHAFLRQQSFSTVCHFAPALTNAPMKVCVSSKICNGEREKACFHLALLTHSLKRFSVIRPLVGSG